MRHILAALIMGALWLGAILPTAMAGQDAGSKMAAQFAAPPDSARPWVYWFWSEGNITREGMTADLEAMRRVGIGGVLIMEVAQDIPKGPVQFGSPKWRELFQHAVAEAGRLGLEVNMNNDAGWSGSGGPWITPAQAMQKIVWTETAVEGPQQFHAPLPRPQAVADYYRDIAVLAFPMTANGSGAKKPFSRARVVDLTARLDKDGRLSWEVPAGKWVVLRLGHTPTGATNVPAPLEGRGLECDKLSKDAMDAHFAGLMGKLIADVGLAAGKTLTFTHIDSWEVHAQNWTPRMREEFQNRRGYDPLPLLPTVAGRTVDSPEVSARFSWDMRKTIAELLNENYAGRLRALAHRHGMQLSIEAYGDFPFDELSYAGRADVPMGEFWVGTWGGMNSVRPMASAAHTYGKNIVGAEAFTSVPGMAKWTNHPFSLKALGDVAFCNGINRFVFHRYAHQPWLDRAPGMTMGPWGVHYERTEMWWEQTRPWHEYLARCNYLLRQGLFVADLCYLQTEDTPRGNYGLAHAPHSAYEFDGCAPEVMLTRMTVRDGRLVLPDGMSYRLLVLPPGTTMTPELLGKIKELVEAGATVVGPRPVKSPSLSGHPQCDARVQELAAELWGNCDGKAVTEHRRGKGRIIWGKTPETVLAELDVPPDFRSSMGTPPHYLSEAAGVRYIHRTVDGTEVYFVANGFSQAIDVQCTFRVKDKRPEFWRPDTGRIEPVAVYDQLGDGTRMPIWLDPCGSVFVVFRADATPASDQVIALRRDGQYVLGASESAAEVVIRKATYGPPGDAARTRDVTTRVRQFSARREYAFQVARMAEGDDPAPGVVKTLTVEYTVNGTPQTARATDPETIRLFGSKPRDAQVRRGEDGRLWIEAEKPGRYEVKLASGRTGHAEVAALPPPLDVVGPWNLRFPPGRGAPQSVTIDKLISWTEHPDAGVKYFSGTATYTKTFQLPDGLIHKDHRIYLDLGRVQVIAEVKLNGRDLGILWKPPFRVDVTDAVKAGENSLEVRATNLWVNRLIGDQQLPDDCKWGPPNQWGGQPLAQWPKWLLDGKPSPTGRQAFTTWRHWTKDSPLLESGLLGPVRLLVTEEVQPAMTAGDKGPLPVKVQLEFQPGHPWLPPFGLDRVGRPLHAVVTGDGQQPPPGEFMLVGFRNGKEVSRNRLTWVVKTKQVWDPLPVPCYARVALDARPSEVVLLFKAAPEAAPVELARRKVPFEAEAIAKPDKTINPVDLGTVLVPADWLLLAGGQKANVEVATVNRNGEPLAGRVTAWYESAPQQRVAAPIPLEQGHKAQVTLALGPCSQTLQRDALHVSIAGADGHELWQKQIRTMIVPKPPAWPAFGAVQTKLRYDAPIVSFAEGKRTWLKYDDLWRSKFQDVVVCLPNGGRFVFWRGASYVPFWASQHNTGLTYEWAERLSPNVGFVDCPEPITDKELRYSRVEIVESTAARVHVRWTYQSCDFNYKVNGDLCTEDFYFYPDGFGTRAVTLTHIPEAEYELAEFIVITPQAAFPLDILPANQGDILAINGEKASLRFPHPQQQEGWKKVSNLPAVYRIRLNKQDPLAAISFSPTLTAMPIPYEPFFDQGAQVTRMYCASIWPLTRGLMTPWDISDRIWISPGTNCLMTFAAQKPKPIRSETVRTKDGLGQMKPMKVETFVWLIGMTDADDETLLHWAQSFAQAPTLELQGARQDSEFYAPERRAMRLVVEKKHVTIAIKPSARCVNPVFELKGAPKMLASVKLGDQTLDPKQYAWDGQTLWINADLSQPTTLRLEFAGDMR